ncbi:DUF7681 family protein [Pseudovibrio ascidiaceicola]|uniref:Acb2/Tad1 domain-containing protein n=1 Tax=Pseudovibrio ascidiaceicola TaxID=285279 RepID=UPI003D35B582
MDNQHKKIKGYRDLSQAEIDLMNEVKAKGEELGSLVARMEIMPKLDQRWVEQGKTNAQTGIMQLVRAIAQPSTF